MAKHLRVDLDQVDMVSTNLHSIVQRLESAQADADQLASAIPVEELADASTDFAGKWDDRRKKLTEQVASLQKEAGLRRPEKSRTAIDRWAGTAAL